MLLKAWNMSDGTVDIHESRCKHRKPSRSGNPPYMQDQVEFGKTDWSSKEAFCYDYWNNGILSEYESEHGEGSFDIWQSMNWKPCTDSLQDNEPLEIEPDPEPAKPRGKSKPARTPRATGHRAYLTKPITQDMIAYARWLEQEFSETFPDGLDPRLVMVALRAYGHFQRSDLSLKAQAKNRSEAA